MVEVRKAKGDTLEFHKVLKQTWTNYLMGHATIRYYSSLLDDKRIFMFIPAWLLHLKLMSWTYWCYRIITYYLSSIIASSLCSLPACLLKSKSMHLSIMVQLSSHFFLSNSSRKRKSSSFFNIMSSYPVFCMGLYISH